MSAVKEPYCTPSRSIWLEITGKDSLAHHQYVLQEENDGQTVTVPLEPSRKYSGRMGPILEGCIESPRPRSLSLVLTGGETIVVPIADNESFGPTRIRPPQRNYQDNLMVAVHPTLFCDAGELGYPRPVSGYNECLPAPMRTGWVYVFFRGRLWRELLVTTSEQAAPALRDTALDSVRLPGTVEKNDRPAVGPVLDTIHIPAQVLGEAVYDKVELAFSDTQWSWQYILGLEEDSALRARRCRNARAFRAFLTRSARSLENEWHRVDDLDPMRSRDNPAERNHLLANQWLRDVEGDKTRAMLDQVLTQREAIESDKAVVDADLDIYTPTLFPHWRHGHLKGEALPEIAAGVDVYQSLRGRNIASLTLRDPLFAARQVISHINESLALLLALVNNIKKRPHGVTAELFHNNFRRAVLPDGTRNPLHIEGSWFDNRLDDSEEGRLLRTVYETERAAIRRFLLEAQGTIVRLLEDERPENLTAVLRDLFALETGNRSAGYMQAGPLLQVLSLEVGRIDPLLLPQQAGRGKADGAEAMNDTLLAGEHPLATMILPSNDPGPALPGDATTANLRAMVAALEDRRQPMRVAEANVLRSITDYVDETSALDAEEWFTDYRYGMHTLSTPFTEVSQWWLGGVQGALEKQGATVVARVNQVKEAFEGFVQVAIPGRTTVELDNTVDGKLYVLMDVVDEQGNTLTSGAAVGASLKLADAEGFETAARQRPAGYWFHKATVSPLGLPPLLVTLDLFNFVNALNYSGNKARQSIGWMSAFFDLVVSSGQLVSVLPQRTVWLDRQVGLWKKEAKWFTKMASSFNAENRFAQAVVRNKLQASGWIAGMLTTSIFVWDAAANLFQGRLKLAGADLTKAVGIGVMTNADIIAGRILTPMGQQLVKHTGEQAVARAVLQKAALWAGLGGTVSAGWVTVIGFGIYVAGEVLYYAVKDDAISEWLRGGPFSGDANDRILALQEEDAAYLGLLKAMMPVSVERVHGARLDGFLDDHDLSFWRRGRAESVFAFSTPALAISGEPVSMEWLLGYERRHLKAQGRAGTETLAIEKGQVRHIDYRFDGHHTIHFVVAEAQLPEMLPDPSNHEYVVTRYWVESLELTFRVKVWDREKKAYVDREITEHLTDLEIEHNAAQ